MIQRDAEGRTIVIDAVLNNVAGFTLVHDEPELDSAGTFIVKPDGHCVIAMKDGSIRQMPRRLPDDVRISLGDITSAEIVRMEGLRPVARSTIQVKLVS